MAEEERAALMLALGRARLDEVAGLQRQLAVNHRMTNLTRQLLAEARRKRRKPPEAGLSFPAIPPKGPRPMQGGAAAPLDFRKD